MVWITNSRRRPGPGRFDILFEEAVTGLQVDRNVRYRGVPVGRVRDIRIDPGISSAIRVTIEVRDDTPVKADAKATLELQGLTGVTYVLMNDGTQTVPRC